MSVIYKIRNIQFIKEPSIILKKKMECKSAISDFKEMYRHFSKPTTSIKYEGHKKSNYKLICPLAPTTGYYFIYKFNCFKKMCS